MARRFCTDTKPALILCPMSDKGMTHPPISITVLQVSDMDIVQDVLEMEGIINVKMVHADARALFGLLAKKLMEDDSGMVSFSLRGKLR